MSNPTSSGVHNNQSNYPASANSNYNNVTGYTNYIQPSNIYQVPQTPDISSYYQYRMQMNSMNYGYYNAHPSYTGNQNYHANAVNPSNNIALTQPEPVPNSISYAVNPSVNNSVQSVSNTTYPLPQQANINQCEANPMQVINSPPNQHTLSIKTKTSSPSNLNVSKDSSPRKLLGLDDILYRKKHLNAEESNLNEEKSLSNNQSKSNLPSTSETPKEPTQTKYETEFIKNLANIKNKNNTLTSNQSTNQDCTVTTTEQPHGSKDKIQSENISSSNQQTSNEMLHETSNNKYRKYQWDQQTSYSEACSRKNYGHSSHYHRRYSSDRLSRDMHHKYSGKNRYHRSPSSDDSSGPNQSPPPRNQGSSSRHHRSSSRHRRSSSRHRRSSSRHRRSSSRHRRSSSKHRRSSSRHRRSSSRHRRSSSRQRMSMSKHRRSSSRQRRSRSRQKQCSSRHERSSSRHHRSSSRQRRSSSRSTQGRSPSSHRRALSKEKSSIKKQRLSPIHRRARSRSSSSYSSSSDRNSSSSSSSLTSKTSSSSLKTKKTSSAGKMVPKSGKNDENLLTKAKTNSLLLTKPNENPIKLSQNITPSNLDKAFVLLKRINVADITKILDVKTLPLTQDITPVLDKNVITNKETNLPENFEITSDPLVHFPDIPGLDLSENNKDKNSMRDENTNKKNLKKKLNKDPVENLTEVTQNKENTTQQDPLHLKNLLKSFQESGSSSSISDLAKNDSNIKKILQVLSEFSKEIKQVKPASPKLPVKTVFHVNFDVEKPVLSDDEGEEEKQKGDLEDVSTSKNEDQLQQDTCLPTQPEDQISPDKADDDISPLVVQKKFVEKIVEKVPVSTSGSANVHLNKLERKPIDNNAATPKFTNINPILPNDGKPRDPRTRRPDPRHLQGKMSNPEQNINRARQKQNLATQTLKSNISHNLVINQCRRTEIPFTTYQTSPSLDSPLESNSNHNSPIYASNLTCLRFPPSLIDFSPRPMYLQKITVNHCNKCKVKPLKKHFDFRYTNAYYYTFLHGKCAGCDKDLRISNVDDSLGFIPDVVPPYMPVRSSTSSMLENTLTPSNQSNLDSSLHDSTFQPSCSVNDSQQPLPEMSPIKNNVFTAYTNPILHPDNNVLRNQDQMPLSVPHKVVTGTNLPSTTTNSITSNTFKALNQPISIVSDKEVSLPLPIKSKEDTQMPNLVNKSLMPEIPPIEKVNQDGITKLNSNVTCSYADSSYDNEQENDVVEFSDISGELEKSISEENPTATQIKTNKNKNIAEINECDSTTNVEQVLECDSTSNVEQESTTNLFESMPNTSHNNLPENLNTDANEDLNGYEIQYSPISDASDENAFEVTCEANDLSDQLIIEESQQANTSSVSNEDVEKTCNKELVVDNSDSQEIQTSVKNISITNTNFSDQLETPTDSSRLKDKNFTADSNVLENTISSEKPKPTETTKDIVGLFDMFNESDFEDKCATNFKDNSVKVPTQHKNKSSEKNLTLVTTKNKNDEISDEKSVKMSSISQIVENPKSTTEASILLKNRECPIRKLSQDFEQQKAAEKLSKPKFNVAMNKSIASTITLPQKHSSIHDIDNSSDTTIINSSFIPQNQEKSSISQSYITPMTDLSDTTDCEMLPSDSSQSEWVDYNLPSIVSRPKKRRRNLLQLGDNTETMNNAAVLHLPTITPSNVPFKKRKYSRVSFDNDSSSSVTSVVQQTVENAQISDVEILSSDANEFSASPKPVISSDTDDTLVTSITQQSAENFQTAEGEIFSSDANEFSLSPKPVISSDTEDTLITSTKEQSPDNCQTSDDETVSSNSNKSTISTTPIIPSDTDSTVVSSNLNNIAQRSSLFESISQITDVTYSDSVSSLNRSEPMTQTFNVTTSNILTSPKRKDNSPTPNVPTSDLNTLMPMNVESIDVNNISLSPDGVDISNTLAQAEEMEITDQVEEVPIPNISDQDNKVPILNISDLTKKMPILMNIAEQSSQSIDVGDETLDLPFHAEVLPPCIEKETIDNQFDTNSLSDDNALSISPKNACHDNNFSDSDCLNLEVERAVRTVQTSDNLSSDDSNYSINFEMASVKRNKNKNKPLTNDEKKEEKKLTFTYKGEEVFWPFESLPASELDAMSDSDSESEEDSFVIQDCSVTLSYLQSTGYAPLCFLTGRKKGHRCCMCCDEFCCSSNWISFEDFSERILKET